MSKKLSIPNWRDPTPADRQLPSGADEMEETRRMMDAALDKKISSEKEGFLKWLKKVLPFLFKS